MKTEKHRYRTLIDESRDEPGHVVATKCTRICVKSGPRTIIEALKNVKLPSGLVGRAWVMKPKKKKGEKTRSGRASCRIRYNRRADKFFAEDKWKHRGSIVANNYENLVLEPGNNCSLGKHDFTNDLFSASACCSPIVGTAASTSFPFCFDLEIVLLSIRGVPRA